MRSNSVTYCSSASRLWLWPTLPWICCRGAVCWPGCCCCWRVGLLWLVGMVQRQGLGLTDSLPGPAAMVVPPLAKWRELASCSQPCWLLNEVSVCGPVLCVLPVCYTWGPEKCFNHMCKQRLHPSLGLGTVQKLLLGVRNEWGSTAQLHTTFLVFHQANIVDSTWYFFFPSRFQASWGDQKVTWKHYYRSTALLPQPQLPGHLKYFPNSQNLQQSFVLLLSVPSETKSYSMLWQTATCWKTRTAFFYLETV